MLFVVNSQLESELFYIYDNSINSFYLKLYPSILSEVSLQEIHF